MNSIDRGCNHCGECCKNNPLPRNFAHSTPEDTVDDSESWNDPQTGWCKYLKDNRDGTYDCTAPVMPMVCKNFPTTPKEIEAYPSCSIVFE